MTLNELIDVETQLKKISEKMYNFFGNSKVNDVKLRLLLLFAKQLRPEKNHFELVWLALDKTRLLVYQKKLLKFPTAP